MLYIKIIIFTLIVQSIILSQTNNIFPENTKPVKLFGDGFFTEGPAQAQDGAIYFSDLTFTEATDMTAGIMWKYDPLRDTTIIFRSPSGMSNGIAFDDNGNMVVCEGADYGGRRITRTDIKTGKSEIVTALFNGKQYNSPNDLTLDKDGRIYFTDPRYAGYETIDQPVMGVYRIDNDNTVHLIISDIIMPNGIAFFSDLLYIGSNFEGDEKNKPGMCIYRFKLNEKGEATAGKIFINYDENSAPDGIKTDEKGNVYVAIRNEQNPGIKVYNQDGAEIDFISMPEIPSNLTFGTGIYSNSLFITAGGSLYKILTLD